MPWQKFNLFYLKNRKTKNLKSDLTKDLAAFIQLVDRFRSQRERDLILVSLNSANIKTS